MTLSELKLDKWIYVLIAIDENKTLSDLSYDLHITYSHIHMILGEFQRLGWVKTYKDGRLRKIIVTPKGNKAFQLAKELQIMMEEN